jgi:hypothetical protein
MVRPFWRSLFAFLLLCSAGPLVAQGDPQPWLLGVRGHFGFLWPHRPAAWYLVEGHSAAFELHAERRFSGDRPWHRHYNGAGYGFGVLYSGMANPEVIGGGLRLLPYLHLPFVHAGVHTFGMRLGWGVGYIMRPFDRRDNIKQIGTGTRVNTAIQLMLEHRVDLGRTRLSTGVSIDHWSNGSVKLPNLGLNLISVNLGIAHALHDPAPAPTLVDTTAYRCRPLEISVVGAVAVSEVARPLSGQYSVYSVVGQAQWQVTPKSSLAAGLDIFNKGDLLTLYPELGDRGRMAHTQLGMHGGWALGFGRAELLVQMGAYLYTPHPDEDVVFHRLGMRYRSGRHLLWHIALKSHWAVADHWEWGLGYRW